MPMLDPSSSDKALLCFMACGAAAGGKSTLIGRLLYECKLLPDDELAAVAANSKRLGAIGNRLDIALPGHDLAAERANGLTMDVPYRCFVSKERKFIVVDPPGHEHYARNMAAAASAADLAVLLVDASRGLLTEGRRDSHIVALLGIRDVALAVNKMDAVDWREDVFERIRSEYRAFAAQLGIANVTCIPVSALHGDNVTDKSRAMPWYPGPTLLDHLETVTIASAADDVLRGDVLTGLDARPEAAEQFSAHVLWTSGRPMLPARSYLLQTGSALVPARVTELKHKLNVDTFEHLAAKHLDQNEIGVCNLALDRPIAFDTHAHSRDMGAFILIDRIGNAPVACGMIDFPLRRDANIPWQPLKIDKMARAALKGQKPCVLWLTGLSGAGKSTIADLVEQSLHRAGHHTIVLDGDNVRHGLNRDLGFTDEDRVENIRRIAEVAKLMVDAGLIVIVSFISPFRGERRMARGLFDMEEFLEVYVDTPLEICEARDPKGLYKLARAGKLPNLTGIGSAYEVPEHPDLVLAAGTKRPDALAQEVLATLKRRGVI